MAAIGSVDLSLVSPQQKLAVSLLNVDFTMLRIDPPKEYQVIGNHLSTGRKQEAEGGVLHSVARKLGVLFEADLPQIPNLLRAYGRRASEISLNKKFNPQSSRKYGAFADHIGADGTSLWAAATSGKEAIAVHLLACMLARVWPGPEATSILSEMVDARKTQLQQRLDTNVYSISEVTAANLTFTRDQLAAWDASARAWLQTADEAFKGQQRELMQIIRQFSATLISPSDLYTSVENVWHRSLNVMEALVSGRPQSTFDAEPLIGLSAWHLYPDVTILGDNIRDVHQHDYLVAPGGILTLGMTAGPSSLASGVTWSLPLSHLKFYGKPVTSTGTLAGDSERISFHELKFVVLGILTGHWFLKTGGIGKVTEFLVNLAECLALLETSLPKWLSFMTSIARDYITAKDDLRKDIVRLYKLGHRRGGRFLSPDGDQFPEAFGLLNFEPFIASLNNSEEAIAHVRERLPKLVTDPTILEGGFISYTPNYKHEKAGQTMNRSATEHDHRGHPDSHLKPHDSEEFATIYVSTSSSSAETIHQRRVPSYHAHGSFDNDSWMVPGMVSPLSEQVSRCEVLTEMTNEVCELYYRPVGDGSGLRLETVNSSDTTEYKVPMWILPMNQKTMHLRRWIKPPFSYKGPKILQTSDPDWLDITEAENQVMTKNVSPRNGRLLAVFSETKSTEVASVKTRSPAVSSPPGLSFGASIWQKRTISVAGTATMDSVGRILTQKSKSIDHLTVPYCTALRDKRDSTLGWFVSDLGCPEKYYIPASGAFKALEEEDQLYYSLFRIGNAFNVWVPVEVNLEPLQMHMDDFLAYIKENIDRCKPVLGRLADMWGSRTLKYKQSLDAFLYAEEIFEAFPEHTVDVSVIKQPLCNVLWTIPANIHSYPLGTSFACLAMFESGSLDISPFELKDIMAMASGNSLFMADCIFSDPFHNVQKHLIRRTIGSIGRPGMTFLVPARSLDRLEPEDSSWRSVPYAEYDGVNEDSFASTTLHLMLTGDEQPLSIGRTGFRDKQAFLRETVVRAYDKARWVADLDLILPYRHTSYLTKQVECEHEEQEQRQYEELEPITSIDSWDEFLDLPPNLSVVRAKDNWVARQAACAFAIQQKKQTILASGTICWKCVSEETYPSADLLVIA